MGKDLAKWGLLHDAAEVYTTDIPSTMKRHLPIMKEIEINIEKVIAEKYNLEIPMRPDVKYTG